jgi:hypothetical protein
MAGIGHNRGPALEPGVGWRRHCWRQARAALLPTLPVEVVRLRVRRAAEIGLDYRTYASIRAASGHDVVAFLFSSNALRLLPPRPALPEDRRDRLAAMARTGRAALVRAPLAPGAVIAAAPDLLDHAAPAPAPFAAWSEIRAALAGALTTTGWPRAGTVLVGDGWDERDWAAAGKLAFYLPAGRVFQA